MIKHKVREPPIHDLAANVSQRDTNLMVQIKSYTHAVIGSQVAGTGLLVTICTAAGFSTVLAVTRSDISCSESASVTGSYDCATGHQQVMGV